MFQLSDHHHRSEKCGGVVVLGPGDPPSPLDGKSEIHFKVIMQSKTLYFYLYFQLYFMRKTPEKLSNSKNKADEWSWEAVLGPDYSTDFRT